MLLQSRPLFLMGLGYLTVSAEIRSRSSAIVRKRGASAFPSLRVYTMSAGEWQKNLIRDPVEAIKIAGAAKRVAVLGIKPDDKWDQPAFFVAEALHSSGVDVVPVPVYYPEVTHILGKPVIRKLADVVGPVDILDVFRRPQDIPAHVQDILKLKPDVVWLQSGITHPEVEEQLAKEGIKVVSNRCLKVDRQMSRM